MFRLMHVWCHVKNKKSFEVKLTFSGILFLVIFLPLESFGSCNKIWNDMKNVFNFLALKKTLLKKGLQLLKSANLIIFQYQLFFTILTPHLFIIKVFCSLAKTNPSALCYNYRILFSPQSREICLGKCHTTYFIKIVNLRQFYVK